MYHPENDSEITFIQLMSPREVAKQINLEGSFSPIWTTYLITIYVLRKFSQIYTLKIFT